MSAPCCAQWVQVPGGTQPCQASTLTYRTPGGRLVCRRHARTYDVPLPTPVRRNLNG